MPYSLEKVTSLIGAHRWGTQEISVDWILTDSRSLAFPETTLFFAIHTQRNDGHKYIADLYRRGVRAFVVEKLPETWEQLYPMASFLCVIDTLKALQRLTERHREEFNIPVVGITGSNGKTIVKEWLYQLLSPSKRIVRSPRSYNSQIGVPLSVWLMNEQAETDKWYSYQTASPVTYDLLKANAKHNRAHPTQAEAVMWEWLKGKQLGVSFRRQHVIGEYIADFVCIECKLVIEIDGGYHTSRQQQEADKLRTQWLSGYGFKVIRFTNEEVINTTETVIKRIKEHLNDRT